MALDLSQLQTDLKKVFSDMKKAGKDAKDTDFSSGIAKACQSYVESGDIDTDDSGSVSGGSYVGKGKGSVKVVPTLMSAPIDVATASMIAMVTGGDAILATAIFTGLTAMMSAGVVTTTVIGILTPPPPSTPIPAYGGSAVGTISCSYPTFVAEFNIILANMNSLKGTTTTKVNEEGEEEEVPFDGDEYMAEELGKLIESFVKSGEVSTNGLATIQGSSGSGGIS